MITGLQRSFYSKSWFLALSYFRIFYRCQRSESRCHTMTWNPTVLESTGVFHSYRASTHGAALQTSILECSQLNLSHGQCFILVPIGTPTLPPRQEFWLSSAWLYEPNLLWFSLIANYNLLCGGWYSVNNTGKHLVNTKVLIHGKSLGLRLALACSRTQKFADHSENADYQAGCIRLSPTSEYWRATPLEILKLIL